MLPEDGDVLVVGSFSGLTVSHAASLIAEKQKSNSGNDLPLVYVCVSDRTKAQREELQHSIFSMGCKSRLSMNVSISWLVQSERYVSSCHCH